jgi:hypothetical protein
MEFKLYTGADLLREICRHLERTIVRALNLLWSVAEARMQSHVT